VEEEFLFLLYKDLGCFGWNPSSHLLQTCAHSVLWGSSRFPMLSVNLACAFAFSLQKLGNQASQWCCDEPQKVRLPGHFARFLVCTRKFMTTEVFLFTYVCMWHAPNTSCTKSRPYTHTELCVSCTGPWSNVVSPMNQ
jgi:hypothetical protein